MMQNDAPRVLLLDTMSNNIVDLAPWLRIRRAFDRACDEIVQVLDRHRHLLSHDPSLDILVRDFRKAASRDELRAKWSREALLQHRAMERRRRADLDPSELSPGEFRRVDRACGSGWRVVLR
jgi:hypothetical protein